MLKAIELIGFKSFATKTRFEFPPGITVVVGPNGSGKSNLVDALKWVLGEQSVKSLRGKEMADVIFNGSGTRRGMNSAEVTVTFDNRNNLLPVDTPEVHITRRVYSGGEGEYLINRQPCRLRDIRDLLSGTGMGTQAYSVIEQGKVDVLLQSSPRDRRMIFEEAAGISRFKAKKIEATRRLERVEQNLLRLSDIVDEVENRLRSIRLQAGKARRYREHTNRLQELRTQVGLVDWRRLSEKLGAFESEVVSFVEQRDSGAAEAELLEARLLEAETRTGDIGESIRQAEAKIAANRERIAANESTMEHERVRFRDMEEEIARHRRQLSAMNQRAGELNRQLDETSRAVDEAEDHHREIARLFAEGERELTDLIANLDRARGEGEQSRLAVVGKMRDVAALASQISGLQGQAVATGEARRRNEAHTTKLREQLEALALQTEELARQREQLAAEVERRLKSLQEVESRLQRRREQFETKRSKLERLNQRRAAAAERASILEELQRRHEGLSPGVKEALIEARENPKGALGSARGLVADLFRVNVDSAQLVEIALGQAAQHIVAPWTPELVGHLETQSHRFTGRVGFLWLDGATNGETDGLADKLVDLEGRPGVLGRADRFVETDSQYAALAERLLGGTWIVEKLAHATALASEARLANFVTVAGERLGADGTLVVGPQHISAGLISRRAELRELKVRLVEMDTQAIKVEEALQRRVVEIEDDQRQLEILQQEHRQAGEELGRHGHQITAADEAQSQLGRQLEAIQTENQTLSAQHDEAVAALEKAQREKRDAEREQTEMEAGLSATSQEVEILETQRQTRSRETTQVQVELAKSEQRLENLRGRMRQFEDSRQERHRGIAESQRQLAQGAARADQSQWNLLKAESEVAELYLRKEAFAKQTVELINQREDIHRQRTELAGQSQRVRAKARKLDEKIHAAELSANEVRHERNSLADRLREDYGIVLAELEHKPTDEEQHQREEVQQEIDELRRKIGNLGNVNLDALAELDDLEGRYETLSTQYKDLVDAKNALEKIIDKINTDSRRLFAETLETVKDHFITLFRQLFGGGRADILLDDDVDILESGIEIVARPPGKELRSISLLSGGEKTLTCVALLLAIFRSRPSPFCVLDEVDAALDEANIDRFTNVLKDFLTWTQFIIVTHSKKTMSSADTVYGVTMQESGVSKQVSVRFEDVSDTGQIRARGKAEKAPDNDDDEPQAA